MNIISFMSANFVARGLDYHMTDGWQQGEQATNRYFMPLATFSERFEEVLRAVRSMGFSALAIWTAHLNYAWATRQHIARAKELLARYSLTVPSLAGNFGSTRAEFDAACRLAVELGAPVLGGGTSLLDSDRGVVITLLQQYGLRLGIENHPGVLTPPEILAKIGADGHGVIAATVDTGWYGTANADAPAAITQLASHIVHVHLKDVVSPGAHETCRFGQGCVRIEQCVRALQAIGYGGAISVEHEPASFDPTQDCMVNVQLLASWLESAES